MSILTCSTVKVKVVEQKENARTITRQSLIVDDAGRVLIRAQSKVFSRNLPAKVVSQIKRQESGIGSIIASSGLETFRKIVEVGYNPGGQFSLQEIPDHLQEKSRLEIRKNW